MSTDPGTPAVDPNAAASTATAATPPTRTAELQAVYDAMLAIVKDPTKTAQILDHANVDGVEDLKGAATLNKADWVGYGANKVQANLLVDAFAPSAASAVVATTVIPTAAGTVPIQPNAMMMNYVIPDVIDGTQFLQSLSTSATLTVDETSIRCALEALFADDQGLSEIPETLAGMIEAFADKLDEPVGPDFVELLKFIRARKYAEVNVDSRLVTKERKAKVLTKLRKLPEAVYQFHSALSGWYEQLRSNRAANPLGVLAVGANLMYPPPDDVIAAAELVVNCLRMGFSGFGVMVAQAMAYEGMKIRETLNDPTLPARMGAANKEMMLREIGCKLTNSDIRTEKNIARYVLFVATKVPNSLPGGQEGPILDSLYQLGQQILPWMTGNRGDSQNPLTGSPRNGKRDGRRDEDFPSPHGSSSPFGRS